MRQTGVHVRRVARARLCSEDCALALFKLWKISYWPDPKAAEGTTRFDTSTLRGGSDDDASGTPLVFRAQTRRLPASLFALAIIDIALWGLALWGGP